MSLVVNATTKFLSGTLSISTLTSIAKIIWIKPVLASQSTNWDLMHVGVGTGTNPRSTLTLVTTQKYRGTYQTTAVASAAVDTTALATTGAWTLLGSFAPAEDGGNQILTLRAIGESPTTVERATSLTGQTKDTIRIARAGSAGTNAQDAKFAKAAVYTGLSLATFNSLFDVLFNDYGTSGEYKAPDHPDALAIATPLYLWDLDTDLANNAEASSTLTLTNNGSAGFDGADNPVFAAATPPVITTVLRPRFIGL